ncbi:bacillithiol biosynthesis cysteine-adding enzyme BshC [Cytobacillus sp. FSL R5-0569]|uniref:bacillithiol biosynthesis cysteine-adding enzyme BshC n=1 Tax=Cytobacillus TaxID=2675230 RepID=UPI00277FB1AA|nr:bacillithiol biosynthesis cysteine-adding enzyme BshC [Cytobacillus kochii]MDQ0184929.1 bacillithiol biosynthesis cysteine-adding enzyme BshC [Cytobacillus kochii]
MEILHLTIPATNRFATEYTAQDEKIQPYFHYRYNHISDLKRRIEELGQRNFSRDKLVSHISDFMNGFPTSEKVQESLKKLNDDKSVVVIGGQQAGIMTGPLYSIHKVISIIAFAKEKERELNIPVVPVFWIAGEDHDYQEVNHIYRYENNQMKKLVYPESPNDKKMVSNIAIDSDVCIKWVDDIIESFGETAFTKDIMSFIHKAIEQSKTYVDIFAHLIMGMFKEHGLLLVDSGNAQLRQLEKGILAEQIKASTKMTTAVLENQQRLQADGYAKMLEISENAANLFYYDEVFKERILLDYNHQTQCFVNTDAKISFTLEEMLTMAETTPEKLSNNVVTRPLTQELLFPTLAFIAGPGEIAYWAELQKVFEQFSLKMPPLVPRLNFTILERAIESEMTELGLQLEDVLMNGTEERKNQFLQSVQSKERDEILSELQAKIEESYKQLLAYTSEKEKGMYPLVEKNQALVQKQIAFIQTKFKQSTEQKYTNILSKFDRIQSSVKPDGIPQERVWNGLYFINKYGLSFFSRILDHELPFDGTHKVMKV